eukprot:466771-Karenia_brevis.AAC.1
MTHRWKHAGQLVADELGIEVRMSKTDWEAQCSSAYELNDPRVDNVVQGIVAGCDVQLHGLLQIPDYNGKQ